MDRIRMALIGYGNVGQAFAEMLKRREAFIAERFGKLPVITAISTRRRGGVIIVEKPFEPEIDHTAYGVLSDLLRILNDNDR